MRIVCTGNRVWILVEKISYADQDFLGGGGGWGGGAGSEVYFPSQKIDQQRLKKIKQNKTT